MPISILLALSVSVGDPPPAAVGAGQQPIVVVCRAEADLRGADIQVRDVAEVRTPDPQLTERLLSIVVGPRPAVGYHRLLTRQDMLLRLTQEGLRADRLQFEGAVETVLRPVTLRIEPQQLRDAADPVLRAALDTEAADAEFEPATPWQPLVLPPGRWSMDLVPELDVAALQHGSAAVRIKVLVDGSEFKTIRLSYRVRRYGRVLMTTTAVRSGTPWSEANVEPRRHEIGAGTSPYLTDLESVRGKVAARDVPANQKLVLNLIAAPAVVHRGDVVSLVALHARVQVAARAVALQDGAVGQHISVKNLTASGAVIQATVHGPGVVVIQPLVAQVK